MPTDEGLVRGLDVQQKMFDMIFGYRVSQTIRTFADLSLADHLADGPLTAAEALEAGRRAYETAVATESSDARSPIRRKTDVRTDRITGR